MPVSNWWTVIDANLQITGGPFMWDGDTTSWSPPPGQRAVQPDPTSQGYSWQGSAATPDTTMSTMNARLTTLENRFVTESRGTKPVPSVTLILGGTTTVRVTLKTAMPSTNYAASALLVGGALLGSLSISAVAIVDRQNVDVTIKAGIALTLTGVSVLVFADAN